MFFDLDETLIENKIPVKDLFARMYFDFEAMLGSENKHVFFNSLREKAANLWSSMFDSDLTPEQQFINCFAECSISTQAVDQAQAQQLGEDMFNHYLRLSSNNVVFNQGAVDALGALNSQGITTGLITNGIEQIQMGKINALDIQDKVDYITISAQARAHKPFAPVFELALQRANSIAENAIQVGDHPTNDVAGAIRAGLGGVYYNPKDLNVEKMFSELVEKPTHHISNLKQVLELI